MSIKQTLTRIFNPETPNYFGEFVTGELNNYQYEGTVLASQGNGLYLIVTPEGYKQIVKNIKRKGDLITRRQ